MMLVKSSLYIPKWNPPDFLNSVLIRGLDFVAAGLEEVQANQAFEQAHHLVNPWLL